MIGNHYFSGRFLLALPMIGDDRFDHAVIYIAHHDESGALGIAMGEPMTVRASEVFDAAGVECALDHDPSVLRGGPVEPGRGFVLHSRDWMGPGSVTADAGEADSPALSGSREVLEAIASGTGPDEWQVALGYAGWGPGQLESEVVGNAWHVTAYDHHIGFVVPPDQRWEAILRRDRIDPARIMGAGGEA